MTSAVSKQHPRAEQAGDYSSRGDHNDDMTGNQMIKEHGIGSAIDSGYHRPGLAACYLMVDDGEAAVIETATVPTLPTLLAALERRCEVAPEQVRWIMPTHVHLDHAGGAGALLGALPERHPGRASAGGASPDRPVTADRRCDGEIYGEQGVREMYGEIVAAPRTGAPSP